MTDHTVECPCCGTPFTGDDPDAARNSVLAHVTGSTDTDHRGIGYQKATKLIDLEASTEAEPSSEAQPSTESIDSQAEPGSYSSESTATDGGPQSVPSFGDQDDQEAAENDECPKCGSEGELVEDLRAREDVPDKVVDVLTAAGDRWCPSCSTSETAEVW